MFLVTSDKIDVFDLANKVSSDKAGALISFDGVVRNQNDNKEVKNLEYEIYDALAIKEGNEIIRESLEQFEIINALAIHRKGLLEIGESAVWIGVSSSHREDGFKACQFIIDEIKHRLPIWKKEYYLNFKETWINCKGCYHHHSLPFDKSEFYGNSINRSEQGKSTAVLVGTCKNYQNLFEKCIEEGFRNFLIVDKEKLKIEDLKNQFLFTYHDLNRYKALVFKKHMLSCDPFLKIDTLIDETEINRFLKKAIEDQSYQVFDLKTY